MCGRFTLHTPPGVLQEHFGVDAVPAMSASYNIAPSQDIAVVRAGEDRRSMALLTLIGTDLLSISRKRTFSARTPLSTVSMMKRAPTMSGK